MDAGEGCVENPEGPGAFGIPYVNPDRVSDDAIDPSNPEVLFYEPMQDGSLRLVGTENAVPIALWDGENPPSLLGHEFHRNDEAGLYGIHIWVWKKNPEGTVSFWHHDVSCQYAGESSQPKTRVQAGMKWMQVRLEKTFWTASGLRLAALFVHS